MPTTIMCEMMVDQEGCSNYRLWQGIGKAIAIESAKEGYRIALDAMEETELSEAAHDVKNTVGESEEGITYIAGDIEDEKTC
jgi:NAD(P)-dependent dehydrogenase (short-subunit alcohol dehydrogenase family)